MERAVSTVVTVAELLVGVHSGIAHEHLVCRNKHNIAPKNTCKFKKDKLAVEVQLGTCLEALTDDGKARPVHKPKLMIVLRKAPDFDKIMAEQAKEREARQEARAAQQVSQQAPAQ
eukprot:1152638-Pelagomonas_calceolata.AAC.1